MPIINYETMRLLALEAAKEYVDGKEITSDRDGLVHGWGGHYRALKLVDYLNKFTIPAEQQPQNGVLDSKQQSTNRIRTQLCDGLLALMIAIYGKTDLWFFQRIGRSSRLASLIADRFISGVHEWNSASDTIDTLTSTVFDQAWINNAKSLSRNTRTVASEGFGITYFDNTKAVRYLLQKEMETIPQDRCKAIWKSVERIKIKLDSAEKKANLLLDFPPIEEELKLNQKTMPITKLIDTVDHKVKKNKI